MEQYGEGKVACEEAVLRARDGAASSPGPASSSDRGDRSDGSATGRGASARPHRTTGRSSCPSARPPEGSGSTSGTSPSGSCTQGWPARPGSTPWAPSSTLGTVLDAAAERPASRDAGLLRRRMPRLRRRGSRSSWASAPAAVAPRPRLARLCRPQLRGRSARGCGDPAARRDAQRVGVRGGARPSARPRRGGGLDRDVELEVVRAVVCSRA